MNDKEQRELRNKYGVPPVQTCFKLEWQGDSLFCWDINILDNEGNYEVLGLKLSTEEFTFKVNAPQTQEILAKIFNLKTSYLYFNPELIMCDVGDEYRMKIINQENIAYSLALFYLDVLQINKTK